MDSTPRSKRSMSSQRMVRAATVEHHGTETFNQVKVQRTFIGTRETNSETRNDGQFTPLSKHTINADIQRSTSSTRSYERYSVNKNSIVPNWFEIEPKTDYTYSHTTSYQASGLKRSPPPNLSRRGIKQKSNKSFNFSSAFDNTSPNHTRSGTVYNNKSYSQCDISLDENFKDFGSEKDSTYSSNTSSYVETATAATKSLHTSFSKFRRFFIFTSIITVWSKCVSYISRANFFVHEFKEALLGERSRCARVIPAKSVLKDKVLRKESQTKVFNNITTWTYIRNVVKKVVTPSFMVDQQSKRNNSSGLTCLYFIGFLLFSILALTIFMSLPPLFRSMLESNAINPYHYQIDAGELLNDKVSGTVSEHEKHSGLAKLQSSLEIVKNDMNSLRTLEARLSAIEKSLEVHKTDEKDKLLMEEIMNLKKKLQLNSEKMNKLHDKYDAEIHTFEAKLSSKMGVNINDQDFLKLREGIEGLKAEFQTQFSDISGYFEETRTKMETFVTHQQLKFDLTELKKDITHLNQSLDKVSMLQEKLTDISSKFQSLELMLKDSAKGRKDTDQSFIELREAISLKVDALQKNCCDEEKILALIRTQLKSSEHTLSKGSIESSKLETNLDSNKKNCLTQGDVKSIVKEALDIHLADKTGLPDYALESAGGAIVDTRCSVTYTEKKSLYRLFGMPIWYVITSPRAIIQPEMQPGNCWAMKGSKGSVVISLATKISPTSFSLEHISRKLSMDGTIASAPKDFSVIALKESHDKFGENLGNFTYIDNGETLQRFPTKIFVRDVKYVLLQILSNHGQPSYTCIYRFRVHGQPKKP